MLVVPEAKRRTGRHLQTWDETPVVPGSCIDFSIVLDVGQDQDRLFRRRRLFSAGVRKTSAPGSILISMALE